MYLTFPKKQVQELLDHSRKAAERETYEQLYDSRLRKDKKEFQPTDPLSCRPRKPLPLGVG